jgi:hypothetical protein
MMKKFLLPKFHPYSSRNMHRLKCILIFQMLFIIACRDHQNNTHSQSSLPVKKKVGRPRLYSDTLTVDKRAAVFYDPDTMQIEKRKKQIGEQDFQTGLDDYAYYINESITFLEQNHLQVLRTDDKNFIRFVRDNGDVRLIKKDTLPDLWGIFLFDPGKDVYQADILDMEKEYHTYFQ